jgi:hypothetical protein
MSPERILVDCAATALEVIDASTGLVRTAQAVRRHARCVELPLRRGHLDAGPVRLDRLAYTQLCPHRRGSDDGGVDDPRTGVTMACFNEPAVNRTRAEIAAHYNTAMCRAQPDRVRDLG